MLASQHCPKCQSEEIIENVRVVDRTLEEGFGGTIHDLKVEVLTKPKAKILKGAVGVPLVARVCADCGFTELYVSDVEKLLDAYKQLENYES